MLNTNLPNIEPREKELLLERRHSICLEISKKRRQSVATSIFLPKDCFQTISKSNGNQTTSRNKKFLTSVLNRKRTSGRILAKRKLKCLTVSNKKKAFTKIQTSFGTLKHPESYAIVKPGVSPERIRSVVESLRDNKMNGNTTTTITGNNTTTIAGNTTTTITGNTTTTITGTTTTTISETCQSYYETASSSNRVSKIDQTPPQNMQIEQKQEDESFEIRNSDTSEEINNASKDDEKPHISDISTNLENETSAFHNKLLNSKNLYSSINRVDNFVIMVDLTGSNVEIKYDRQQLSSNEGVTLHNCAGEDEYTSGQVQDIKQEYVGIDYIKANNCPTTTTTTKRVSVKPVSLNTLVNRYEAYNEKPDNVFTSNSSQSNHDIIDLTLRETSSPSIVNQQIKLNYPAARYKPPTDPSINTSPLPTQQTSSICHQNRFATKSASSNNCSSCCSNYETAVPPQIGAQAQQTHFTTLQPHQLQSHHQHYVQPTAYFETPPISPREQQYLPVPTEMNFPMYEFNQHHHQNQSVPQYSLDQHSNQVPHSYDKVSHRKIPHDHNVNIQHHLRQVPANHQTNFQLQPTPHSFVQYQHQQPNQTYNSYQYQQAGNYYNIELPCQFYPPVHRNFLPYPNNFNSLTSALPASINRSQLFGAQWHKRNTPKSLIPPHEPNRSTANYPLPRPTTSYRNLPIEHSMPINFPFPSSNWTNTLNNSSVVSLKAPSHYNISTHTYPIYPGFHSEADLINHLNINASTATKSNTMRTDRTLSRHWPSTYMNRQAPPAFSLNYM